MKKRFILFMMFALGLAFVVSQAEANVILRVIAANPSKGQTQSVPVKVYLPKEVKPDDIINKADLQAAYDTQQGSYYAYGEYELKPGETVEKEIELKDIWVIPDKEIKDLRAESSKLVDLLKNTDFADRVAFLKESIDAKLSQIEESQKNAPPNPERHISEYRDNLKTLESVKADLSSARSFLSQVKAMPTIVVWRLIIGIIVFLGLLGLSFYFVWNKQLKSIAGEDTFTVAKEEKPSGQAPQQHKAQENSPGRSEDNISG
ncbi:MAG: hypothetical protein NTY47_04220 [Candidatus Omnitrophica bacterium]|nr:hypothetical protein [Candidatus Omnitrophota bacterium]